MRLVVALLVVLALPASAQAATVAREGSELVYRSAPGEKDDFVVQDSDDVPGKVFFYEYGKKLTLGAGCVKRVEYPECSTEGITAFRVFAGDGNDKVRVLLRLPVFVDLGEGDDDYGGRALVLTITGGEGKDHIDAEIGGGTMDLGPGDDTGIVAIASVFTGPLSVAGGDGNDDLSVWGHAEPGISVSGGAGNDDISSQIYESTTGMDVSCGPGNDRTRVRLADRMGEGCAPTVNGFDPSRSSRAFTASLTAPARVEVVFRRRPGGGLSPAEALASGSGQRPAGPFTLRLKTTKAGRKRLRGDAKLYVFVRTKAGGDRHEVRFDSRLLAAAATRPDAGGRALRASPPSDARPLAESSPATVAREGTEIVYRGSPGEDKPAFDGRTDTLIIGGMESSKPRITPGTGCKRTKRAVHCSLAGVTALRIFSRGSDDILSVRANVPVFVDLGAGDDDVDGEAPSLTVTAGEGTDRVGFLAAAGAVDLGPGEDYFSAELPKGFTGPLTVEGGEGRDLLSLYGTVAPGVSFSGGPGDDELILQALGGPGIDVACGAGADRVEVRIEDRVGEGCAPALTLGTLSRTSFTGALSGPATGKVTVYGGKHAIARGTFTLTAAGPLAVRLKPTTAGRRSRRTKVYVTVRIRTGSDESEVGFPSRLT